MSLHPKPHIIEPNQSNQTMTSPPSNNTSNNPTSMSSPQSPDNPVPIESNIDTSPQQSDASHVLRGTDQNKTVDPQHI